MQKCYTGLKRGLVPECVFWVQKLTFNFSDTFKFEDSFITSLSV